MLVNLHQVHLRYGKKNPVLTDVNLELEPGSFHFVTGASGAGKSSLLRLIYLAERPTSGRVRLFGKDTTALGRDDIPALRRRLGVVFQDFRLIPHLSALENAALPLRLSQGGFLSGAGSENRQIREHVTELLNWVGLGDRLNALPSELSGGEQQRVAIARAVVNKPRLLLADEPTGNVDDETALKLLHLFNELNKMGTTILIATHQKNLVRRMGRPSLHLQGGRIHEDVPEAA